MYNSRTSQSSNPATQEATGITRGYITDRMVVLDYKENGHRATIALVCRARHDLLKRRPWGWSQTYDWLIEHGYM